MKKTFCDICNKILKTDAGEEAHFIVKVKSPFINEKSYKAHVCEDCYDKLEALLNRGDANGTKND